MAVSIIEPPPLALYVHLPWCRRKCPYCDFNSYALKESFPEERYLAALRNDLEAIAAEVAGRPLISIFLGGGTPSLFSPKAIGMVLTHAKQCLGFAPDIEITMEANPGTVEHAAFAEYRDAGVNRLSLGVQSLNDTLLYRLQRIHSADEARQAIRSAQAVFANINLDFMFALPGQDEKELADELREACSFGVAHLSWYQLTLEPNTPFSVRPPEGLPDDDTTATMHEQVIQHLVANGYQNYEVSAFARPGQKCRHNQNYWQFGDYLGIGAGAHAKITHPDGRIVRTARKVNPQQYMEKALANPFALPVGEQRALTSDDLGFEFMLNALRLKDGVPRSLFPQRTGATLDLLEDGVQEAIRRGLLADNPERFVATPLGFRYLNETLQCFLKD